MKKILSILLAVCILMVTSCKSNDVTINKIYREKDDAQVDYQKALASSCAISNGDVTYSGTVIDYDKKDSSYYIMSYSQLGTISTFINNVKVFSDSDSSNGYSGKIIGLDSKNAFSLVKVSAPEGTFSTAKLNSNITLAQDIITVSTPFSNDNRMTPTCINSVTSGIVSHIDSYYFMTSAAMNPSSYGGGVYDNNCNLIGILSEKVYTDIEKGEYVEGMTCAISADYVLKSYNDMKELGEVTRSSLGITVTQCHKALLDHIEEDIKVPNFDYTYVAVTGVDERGNCYRKLQVYDLIDYINGVKIYTNDDISVFIHYAKIGDSLNFKIKRYDSLTKKFNDIDVEIVISK